MNKTLGLIIALSIAIPLTAQELQDETKHTNISASVDNVSVLITEIPVEGTGVASFPTASAAESSSIEAEATLRPEAIPLVPLEITAPDKASDEASDYAEESGVTDGDQDVDTPWYSPLWNYLAADEDSVKAKAAMVVTKMKLDRQYGEGSSEEPNLTTLLEVKDAMIVADERRRQAELAMQVEEENRRRLYDESLLCLALNGYHEARGQTADQEVATAAVVLNRLSVNFRNATTICEVIYTPKQFSWVEQHGVHVPDTSNKLERQAWERSLLIARRMLDPDATFIDPSNGAQYYYNPHIVDWPYAPHYRQVAVLGSHRFMAEKDKSHPHYIDNNQVRINPVLFNGLKPEERKALISEYQQAGE